MIKLRGLPARGIVATGTVGDLFARGKLGGVGVGVAARALLRGDAVVHVPQGSLEVRRAMTVDAFDAAVRAKKRESSGRMVEAREPLPGGGRVATLAARPRAIGAAGFHPGTEFAAMRIGMTCGASAILEAVLHRFCRAHWGRFVTFHASNGRMRAGEWEARLLVPRQGKMRRAEALHVVAGLAPIQMWRGGELPFVNVLVAIPALCRSDLEERVFALGQMAFRAGYGCVLCLEGVLRRRVLLDAEDGRSKALDRVTRGAFSGIGPGFELARMGVLVTVHALCVRHGCLEVAFGVALAAGNGLVLAQKRIFRLRVVEAFETLDVLPVGGRVAGLARRGEAALVRIGVAGCALFEGKADEFDIGFRIRQRGMALLAGDFLVRAGQRVLGCRMMEARGRLPALECMAAGAIGAQLPVVFVAVATGAVAGQTEIRAIQILDEDAGAGSQRNVIGFVALLAGHGGMAAFEHIARLAMIEGFAAGFPMDELKALAVVVRMALCALRAGGARRKK